MDARQKTTFYELQIEHEKFVKVENQLLMSEAFQFAYIGSQPTQKGQINKAANQYKKWRSDKMKKLYPDWYKENQSTVWDRFSKKRKSVKIH